MKYFRKKRKDWIELSDSEKINYLTYNQSIWSSMQSLGLIVIIFGLLLFVGFQHIDKTNDNTDKINFMYEQLNISINEELNQTIQERTQETQNWINFTYGIVLYGIFVYLLYVASIFYYKRKYKPFLDSLKKDEEVKY